MFQINISLNHELVLFECSNVFISLAAVGLNGIVAAKKKIRQMRQELVKEDFFSIFFIVLMFVIFCALCNNIT